MYGMQHFNLHILIYQIFKSNLLQARPTHMYRNAKRGRKMNPMSKNLRNKLSRIWTKMKVKMEAREAELQGEIDGLHKEVDALRKKIKEKEVNDQYRILI